MNVYLESSAALRDLLESDQADAIRATLAGAAIVVTSRLTMAEVGRICARLRQLDPAAAAGVASREAVFMSESDLWAIMEVDEAIWTRSARPFPVEPVRIMDAVHLATIERASGALGQLVVLSTDRRVRSNAVALGFAVSPGEEPGQAA